MGPHRTPVSRLLLLAALLLQAWVPFADAMSCTDCLHLLSKASHINSSYQTLESRITHAHSSPDGNMDLCPGGVECCPVCANASAAFLPAHAAPITSVVYVLPEAGCTVIPGITSPVFRPPELS